MPEFCPDCCEEITGDLSGSLPKDVYYCKECDIMWYIKEMKVKFKTDPTLEQSIPKLEGDIYIPKM